MRNDTAPANLVSVDLADLEFANIPGPGYALEPLIPYGLVTLLAAHGGAGKSVLALTIAAHFAAGVDWAGLHTGAGRAVFVSLEDDGDLVRLRLRRICRAYELDMVAVSDSLTVLDGTAGQTALVSEINDEGVRRLACTTTLEEMAQACTGAGLIIVDNASDAFDGDENSRRQVRTFLRYLGTLARDLGAGLLLLAHIDKNAAKNGANGNSYSGSTAWHNSARSRIALVTGSDGIELVHEKLNVGRTRATMALQWTDAGVLIPSEQRAANPQDELAAANAEEFDLLAVFAAAEKAGATISTGRSGSGNTMAVLATLGLPKWARGKGSRERFWQVLNRLQAKGLIELDEYVDRYRHTRQKFVVRELRALRESPQTPLRTPAGESPQSALDA